MHKYKQKITQALHLLPLLDGPVHEGLRGRDAEGAILGVDYEVLLAIKIY